MSVCKSLLFKQAVKTVTSKVLATFKVFKVSVTIPPPLGTCHLELERQSVTDVNLCSIISIVNSANEWPTISLALAFLSLKLHGSCSKSHKINVIGIQTTLHESKANAYWPKRWMLEVKWFRHVVHQQNLQSPEKIEHHSGDKHAVHISQLQCSQWSVASLNWTISWTKVQLLPWVRSHCGCFPDWDLLLHDLILSMFYLLNSPGAGFSNMFLFNWFDRAHFCSVTAMSMLKSFYILIPKSIFHGLSFILVRGIAAISISPIRMQR